MRDFKIIHSDTPELSFGYQGDTINLADPITASFARNSTAAHLDSSLVAVNEPRFENGRYGKGILIESGAVNLFPGAPAPDILQGTGGGTVTLLQADPWGGTLAARCVFTSAQSIIADIASAPGQTYQFQSGVRYEPSFFIKNNGTTDGYIRVSNASGAGSWVLRCNGLANEWQRITRDHSAIMDIESEFTGTGFSQYALIFTRVSGTGAANIYVAGFQVEATSYSTTYIPGNNRQPETCTIPTSGILSVSEGTIECWVKKSVATDIIGGVLFCANPTIERFYIQYDGVSQRWIGVLGDDPLTAISNFSGTDFNWHYIAMTWTRALATLYVDGIGVSVSNPHLPDSFDIHAHIGSYDHGSYMFNGIISDLLISPRAKTTAEIAEAASRYAGIKESGQTILSFNNTLQSEQNPFPIPLSANMPAYHTELNRDSVVPGFSSDIMNNIYLSLAIERGSWWFNPDFGLRPINRMKNTEQTARLIEVYIREALQWLLDMGRAKSIDVYLKRDSSVSGRICAVIEAVQTDGLAVQYSHYIEVV